MKKHYISPITDVADSAFTSIIATSAGPGQSSETGDRGGGGGATKKRASFYDEDIDFDENDNISYERHIYKSWKEDIY